MIIVLLLMVTFLFPINIDDIVSSKKAGESTQNKEGSFSGYNKEFDYLLLDETIKPEKYKVGPGDNLSFNLISSDASISLVLPISPIGDILIPNIGNILIDNMLLSEAINKIKKKCKEKYNNAEVFISLHSFRKFNVQVFGPGINKGYLTITPVHRLSYIFSELTQDSEIIYSLRNVELIKNNLTFSYDLLDFFIFGNEESNPYIEQNDKIKLNIRKDILEISGSINIPGIYDYKSNESLQNLISIAGGFRANADSNYIEITRFKDDNNYELIKIDDFVKNQNFILKNHDNIRVRSKKQYKKTDYISINGEIKYPGHYLLSEVKSYKDLIDLAGGYTEKADTNQIAVNNSIIQFNKDLELERIKLIPPIDRTPSEKSYLNSRKKITKGAIRSNDEFFSNFIKNNTLEIGDEVFISQKMNYVEIIGAVLHPGRYNFLSSKTLTSYISDAGGYSSNASNQKYLIKVSDGKRISLSKKPNIESGDIIFISEKEDYNQFVRFKEVLQILGNFAALIAVIQTVSK